jgi:hypothetical protein
VELVPDLRKDYACDSSLAARIRTKYDRHKRDPHSIVVATRSR